MIYYSIIKSVKVKFVGHNFQTRSDKAFILDMSIPYSYIYMYGLKSELIKTLKELNEGYTIGLHVD